MLSEDFFQICRFVDFPIAVGPENGKYAGTFRDAAAVGRWVAAEDVHHAQIEAAVSTEISLDNFLANFRFSIDFPELL
jgi:hypothetical protein